MKIKVETKKGEYIMINTKPVLHPGTVKIKCFFTAPFILVFSDQLLKDNIPVDAVFVDLERQPAGIIFIDYAGQKPQNVEIIEKISESFENFCENGNGKF